MKSWCFRNVEYATWSAMNPAIVASVSQFTSAVMPSAATATSAPATTAVRGDSSPRAIGRPAVRGLSRSASASTASLMRYAAPLARQNATNTAAAVASGPASTNWPE